MAQERDCFELGVDFEFRQGRPDLGADGGDGDGEVCGDGAGVVTLREKVENLSFSVAEPIEALDDPVPLGFVVAVALLPGEACFVGHGLLA
ncbi:MAG: hypothetical protein QOC67_4460, partial [Pseudonocardiales bacterium]|nr:hypothetical protein [Pseudonocardiales bacterium]